MEKQKYQTWGELIAGILEDFRLTTYSIKKKYGIDSSTIGRIKRKGSEPAPNTILALEYALKIKIHDEDENNLWYEKVHIRTERQEHAHNIISGNPIWSMEFIKYPPETQTWIHYQIYNAEEIDNELYETIVKGFTIPKVYIPPGPSVPPKEAKYPERKEDHNNKEKAAADSSAIYNKQTEILERLDSIEEKLAEKDKRIEELEEAVQVLGAKLGITGTLVQILEAVKSGRLS
jgi:hypothetical protein